MFLLLPEWQTMSQIQTKASPKLDRVENQILCPISFIMQWKQEREQMEIVMGLPGRSSTSAEHSAASGVHALDD